jgi:phage gpG-like protein
LHLEPLDPARLTRTLTQWEERLTNLAPAFAAIYENFQQIEKTRFDAEGPGWQTLAASTLARKRKLGQPETILEATGRLRASLTNAGAQDSIFRDEGEAVFMGTDTPYAHWHQTGGTIPGRPPKREAVQISEAGRVRWATILARYLAHGEIGAVTASIGTGPSGM